MTPRHVHFIGVAGTGMGSLAGLLRARGIRVTGCDEGIYPPMSIALEKWGIPCREGFSAERLLDDAPDLVVIGNVIRPDNPEAQAAIDQGLAYMSFPDALYDFAIRHKHSVVVTGTHGKTTVTSLLVTLLMEASRDPSALLGGISLNLDGSFLEGSGEHFVVEGDEYDTAFFDKTPKFLHYGPQTAVLTSVEFDHADIYRDLDHVKDVFKQLVDKLPSSGTLVAHTVDANVRDVVAGAACRVVEYGVGNDAALEQAVAQRLPLYGQHNLANGLAAVVAACELGLSREEALAGLAAYRGVKRRQEIRGEVGGITVIDDFAHHPTAVRETVAAMATRYPDRRLIAIFEPRSNTSRRAVFQQDYATAFAGADQAVISVVPDAPIYSATGEVTERFSAAELAQSLNDQGIPALALDGPDAILEHLLAQREPGDVFLVMSNGDFGNLCSRLLEGLSAD